MITRRGFLQGTAATAAALLLSPRGARAGQTASATHFRLHSFIEANPESVFILRTSVDRKTDAAGIYTAGHDLGRSIFLPSEAGPGAVPLTSAIAIKPNLTCRDSSDPRYTTEGTMGIVTDVYFVEGLINSLKDLTIAGSQVFIREVNCPSEFSEGGYVQMCQRTGAQIADLSLPVGTLPEEAIVWKDVPEGVWFSRLPFLRPVNAPDSWLLNVAKFKAHKMGLTLCSKNLQGTHPRNYQAHCTALGQSMAISASDVRSDAEQSIRASYSRHLAAGTIPRWDRPEPEGGLWMETWAARCLDNNSVTRGGLHIIEGIYGRDGHFIDGPSPSGTATDYVSNFVLFGKNAFHVDSIGHWLGGHEPGNFGLFHMAIERKLSSILDPARIPLYEWKTDGTATRIALSGLSKTPLLTNYLTRNYSGQTEPQWHLVDEPYTYPGTDAAEEAPPVPQTMVLARNYPNPFNGSTAIQYSIPRGGHVLLEIYDVHGAVIDRLVSGHRMQGKHLASWASGERSSGVYFCRLVFEGHAATTRMVLLR